MVKKLVILFLFLAVLFSAGVNIFARKAPDILRSAIERSLDKKVIIRSIEYHFPWSFTLQGFEIKEKSPFEGETSFYVEEIKLDASPFVLSKKKLTIDKIEVENASIVIRKYRGKLTHAFSDAMKKSSEVVESVSTPPTSEAEAEKAPATQYMPLSIGRFIVKKSHFKFIDYDADEKGFVIVLSDINADIRDIHVPFSSGATEYRIDAVLPQGRDERPGELRLSGWTDFSNRDTDANLNIQGVALPYFKPYYAQVTSAAISAGYLDCRTNLRIEKNDLTLNVDLEILGLLFEAYESENQLFGLKADEILSFLKDRSGKLKFQVVAEWNIADRSVKARDVIRRSIERSLKSTVIGNVGNILENTLQKISEKGLDQTKNDLEGKLKKIKDFFKY